MKYYYIQNIAVKSVVAFFCLLFFSQCAEDPKLAELRSDQQVISDYIKNKPDQFRVFCFTRKHWPKRPSEYPWAIYCFFAK
jgi:hypothetical protein